MEAKITPEMIEAGLEALDRWADRHGVEDVPAARQLVAAVLAEGKRKEGEQNFAELRAILQADTDFAVRAKSGLDKFLGIGPLP